VPSGIPAARSRSGRQGDDRRPTDHPAVFHVTHHKAGSQWILAILRRVARPLVVNPDGGNDYLRSGALEEGRIYPTVYLSRPEFEQLDLPERWLRFIVIRDFRDALVSAYWSLKLSHPEGSGTVSEIRGELQQMNLHDGLIHLIPRWQSEANIVASWVGCEDEIIRYEDLVGDDVGILVPLICDRLGLADSPDRVRRAVESARFEQLTKGRPRGSEDVNAHQRKGVSGDWRNYIVGPVADAFKQRYGQLLIDTGYETDLDW